MKRPLLGLCAFGLTALGARFSTAAPLRVQHAAVASDHRLASEAGVAALKRGGNAFDAACATALAVGVLHPQSSGIGGGGFAVAYLAKRKQFVALDFRERAPRLAAEKLYRKGQRPAPELAQIGALAIAVPGEVAGLARLVEEHGKLGFERCTEAAAHLAMGFAAHAPLLHALDDVASHMPKYADFAAIFAPHGKRLVEGELVRRPDLARTLREIGRDPRVFYRGSIARGMVDAVKAAGGLLSLEDLAEYEPTWRQPLVLDYRGHSIATMPPPSSGGITLSETLNLLERRPIAALGHNSDAYLHLLAEALKHAFADRARHLGDPDFVRVPVKRLMSKSYAELLFKRIGAGVLAPEAYGSGVGSADLRDSGTTHLSVVDAEGNAVALTSTVNLYFGSLVIAGHTGILMNDQMDDFSVAQGVPNAFGLVGNVMNAIAPKKRPLSSMSPTLVMRDGRVRMALGGAGGPRIITATLQTLLNVLDFRMPVDEAIRAPRMHAQWSPDTLFLEPAVSEAVKVKLRQRGHRLAERGAAVVNAITVSEGFLEAASDARKNGAPAGY